MGSRIFALVAIFFALSDYAAADNGIECILDLKEVLPRLAGSTPEINEKKRLVIERTQLPNGIKVTFSQGGCVHYGYSLLFDNVPALTMETPFAKRIQIVKALLAELPLRTEGDSFSGEIDKFSEALEKESNENWIACGDATCSLSVTQNGQLELGYDFPL